MSGTRPFSSPMSKAPVYVSLDLETTGLDAEADAITEIAAVKFDAGGMLDTFSSLVNPHRAIPYHIQQMCGITQAEVDAAPDVESLVSDLKSFIGANPVLGHNVAFDIGFLAQNGLQLFNRTHDTFELSTIFLPNLSGYSLEAVAEHLGYSYKHHRALADAEAAKDVFLSLLNIASGLSLDDIAEIERLVAGTGMSLEALLVDIKKLKAQTAFADAVSSHEPAAEALYGARILTPRHEKEPLRVEELSEFLQPSGALSEAFDTYEYRPQQQTMLSVVAQAFNQDEHLLVEAGTGTGKSVAYLLPAMVFAESNNAHVVVSTNTINLQEQLLHKDIPQLLSAIGSSAVAVQLKGRSNYLCRRRYNMLRTSPELSHEDVGLLLRILVWLKSTTTGDRAELNLAGNESGWSKVCAKVEGCLFSNCPHLKKGACFLQRARQAAEGAHIIVINHALLLSDAASGSAILPSYAHLIIDEAHHLESEATRQFGYEITRRNMANVLDQLSREMQGQQYAGVLYSIGAWMAGKGISASKRREIGVLTEAERAKVERARVHADEFFTVFKRFIEQYSGDNYRGNSRYDRQIRITQDVRVQPGWYRVEAACENLILALKDVIDGLNGLISIIDPLSSGEGYDVLEMEITAGINSCAELSDKLKRSVFSLDREYIDWISIGANDDSISLNGAPLSVAGLLSHVVFSEKDTVVLTSATLSTEGNFDYLKERLGLEYVEEMILDAPFDYKKAAVVCVPTDVPEPNRHGYQQALEKTLVNLCQRTQGRALVLFTSHAALRATHAAIRPVLEEQAIVVLGQGIDGSARKLLEFFKTYPRTVLLGAASFWEGVDVVGDALSVLVLVRLPFAVPTDPVFAARSETFDDSFHQYALPQAILRFKQGFGRLIRSATDKGVMVVLDRRVKSKRYGAAFLDSLPAIGVISSLSSDIPRIAERWISGSK